MNLSLRFCLLCFSPRHLTILPIPDQEHSWPSEPVREHPEGFRRGVLQWDGPQLRGWPPWCRARSVFIFGPFYSSFIFCCSFRWGQWECVWDGWCEKKAGWLGTFNGGGPQPPPKTSAPFKKVIAQDFVIFLLKTSGGVSWFLDYDEIPHDVDFTLVLWSQKRSISDFWVIATALVTLHIKCNLNFNVNRSPLSGGLYLNYDPAGGE